MPLPKLRPLMDAKKGQIKILKCEDFRGSQFKTVANFKHLCRFKNSSLKRQISSDDLTLTPVVSVLLTTCFRRTGPRAGLKAAAQAP